MWTFQTESRKKARKLVVERLMGSSPVWLQITYLASLGFLEVEELGDNLNIKFLNVFGKKY